MLTPEVIGGSNITDLEQYRISHGKQTETHVVPNDREDLIRRLRNRSITGDPGTLQEFFGPRTAIAPNRRRWRRTEDYKPIA